MMRQMSIFDGAAPFKIDKPIRLITLFSGYDSQALALKYLGVPFEHYRTCEWAIPSIQALHDLHFADDMTDYSAGMNKAELVEVLAKYGISADYNQPLPAEKIRRYGEDKLRTIYNNIKSEKKYRFNSECKRKRPRNCGHGKVLLHYDILVSLPRFEQCRITKGNGKGQRHALGVALGS